MCVLFWQVVHNVGLCIALWDIVSLADSYIFPGDGSSHTIGQTPFAALTRLDNIMTCLSYCRSDT